ncbi:adenylate/guanylate cyclase domain-containing protein [Methylobacterium sp. P31]
MQKLNSIGGMILFAFATTHFLNHALGLISPEVMYEAQQWRWTVTRSIPGSLVFAAALIIHIVYALARTAQRSTFRLSGWEWLQLASGLLIPILLLPHMVNTRGARVLAGTDDSYLYELARLWPEGALLQSTLLLLVWTHGCVGLHTWLRATRTYRAAQPALLFLAIVIPAAALAGFAVSGRAVAALIEDPAMLARVQKITHWPDPADASLLEHLRQSLRLGFVAVIALMTLWVVAGFVRGLGSARITVHYVGGPTVQGLNGATLLEISRAAGVPHAALCGGRSRCGTCRVRIEGEADSLPPLASAERETLHAIGAGQGVRLACQLRPSGPLTVARLLRPAGLAPATSDLDAAEAAGIRKDVAILAFDMRDFAELTNERLAYDIIFFLSSVFSAVGAAIEAQGGWIVSLNGSSLVAVFGRQQGPETGCRQALAAARAIDLSLDTVNAKLAIELGRSLDVAIGITVGPVLVGRIGPGAGADLTAFGGVIGQAERLRARAAELGLQVVISEDAGRRGGWSGESAQQLGPESGMALRGLPRARDLPAV